MLFRRTGLHSGTLQDSGIYMYKELEFTATDIRFMMYEP